MLGRHSWQFDDDHYQLINERRRNFLAVLWAASLKRLNLRTALDTGCGVGYFSDYLRTIDLAVTGSDAREQNVTEAGTRYPDIDFHTWNVEDPYPRPNTQYDMVLCFGLLYHLENPFRAIRNLHAITGSVLVIESVITQDPLPIVSFVEEPARGEAQALNYVALVPSESAFIKMLYASGFSDVYKTNVLPDHEHFTNKSGKKRRTILVAANAPNLPSPLYRVPDPPHYNIRRHTADGQPRGEETGAHA